MSILRSNPLLWGLSLCFVWKGLVESAVDPGLSTLSEIVAPILVVAFWRALCPGKNARGLIAAASLIACAGSFALYSNMLGDFLVSHALILGISFLTCSAVNFLIYLWFNLYATCSTLSIAVILACSNIITPLINLLFFSLPETLRLGASAMTPLVGGCLLDTSRDAVPSELSASQRLWWQNHASGQRETFLTLSRELPWGIVVIVAALSFATGASRIYTTPLVNSFGMGISGLLTLGVALIAARRFSLFVVLRIALPVMMCGLIVGIVLPSSSLGAQLLINASYGFAILVLMILLYDKSYRFGPSAIFMIALARAFARIVFIAGSASASVFAHLPLFANVGYHAIIYGVITLAIACWTVFWFSSFRSGAGLNAPPAVAGQADPVAEPSIIERRCAQLSAEYHLSEREAQVLSLLACGRDGHAIEGELSLSYNTVRTHIRHIYTKLGVHSRGELKDLVGGQ